MSADSRPQRESGETLRLPCIGDPRARRPASERPANPRHREGTERGNGPSPAGTGPFRARAHPDPAQRHAQPPRLAGSERPPGEEHVDASSRSGPGDDTQGGVNESADDLTPPDILPPRGRKPPAPGLRVSHRDDCAGSSPKGVTGETAPRAEREHCARDAGAPRRAGQGEGPDGGAGVRQREHPPDDRGGAQVDSQRGAE